MNAVDLFSSVLTPESIRRLARSRASRFDEPAGDADLDVEQAREHVVRRWGGDLCGLLNAMTRGELTVVAGRLGVAGDASPELRERLWAKGADLERHGIDVGAVVQPRPVVIAGHLVICAPPRGAYPPSERWPRPLPESRYWAPVSDEPESVDDLLAAAERLIGVRLGHRGRDKGAWGSRASALLGVTDRGLDEPDWRGDVELKTVPVAVDRGSGRWRVVEDPAIAMVGEHAFAKLQRTLWLVRADVGDDDATILSWYLLDWDPEIARLARRYLHVRPKGAAGSDGRGLYLHKRFFADAGLLATLNGPS